MKIKWLSPISPLLVISGSWLCPNYAEVHSNYAWLSYNITHIIPTAKISFDIPFQQYKTWLYPWRVHFWPNYASIMQKLLLIMHLSAWASSANIPTTEISFWIFFQWYDMAVCTIGPFLAWFGHNYAEKYSNYAWFYLYFIHKYYHYWDLLQNTFPTVYDMTICMKNPFFVKFGLNHILIMQNLINYAWPG